MDRPALGLVQSLVIKGQRELLDDLGRRVGTPVLYLKAAWADPVLYGGRGERAGSDLDILVSAPAFHAFARELEKAGFRRYVTPWLRATFRWGYKAWTYMGAPRWVTVDLHRGLAEPPWFELPPADCIARRSAYDSVDGPIISLCPEDQILYAAAHYANHRFAIDQKHLDDMERLVAAYPIDWALVRERATRQALALPLALLIEGLVGRGAPVPASAMPADEPLFDWRMSYAHRWVATQPELKRLPPTSRITDNAVRLPLLSGRALALPRYVAGYLGLRVLVLGAELAARLRR